MPRFDPVALPTLYPQDPPADAFGGILSDGAIMMSVDWQVIGNRETSPERPRPDLDISGLFQATEQEACHIFTGNPSCGDVEIMPDLRDCETDPSSCECETDSSSCPILDGPV